MDAREKLIAQVVTELGAMPEHEKKIIFHHVGEIAAVCLRNLSTATLVKCTGGFAVERSASRVGRTMKTMKSVILSLF